MWGGKATWQQQVKVKIAENEGHKTNQETLLRFSHTLHKRTSSPTDSSLKILFNVSAVLS